MMFKDRMRLDPETQQLEKNFFYFRGEMFEGKRYGLKCEQQFSCYSHYFGDMVADTPHGFGVFTYFNRGEEIEDMRSRYEGWFNGGKYHGLGQLMYDNRKEKVTGFFRDGVHQLAPNSFV